MIDISDSAEFDGDDYQADRDRARLVGQLQRVYDAVVGGQWMTLRDISKSAKAPEASVSAQLRNLRKPKFGGHTVNKRYIGDGLYKYQFIKAGAE